MVRRVAPGMFFQHALGKNGIEHAPGEILAGCTIIRKAASATKETRWHVTASCGCKTIMNGQHLRRAEREGLLMLCDTCKKLKLPKLVNAVTFKRLAEAAANVLLLNPTGEREQELLRALNAVGVVLEVTPREVSNG